MASSSVRQAMPGGAARKPSPVRHYFPHFLWTLGGGALLLGASIFLPRIISPYIIQILVFVGCNLILAASLNLINGTTGQFSIGHAGFMALGAYSSAYISVNYGQHWLAPYTGTPLWPVMSSLYLIALMVIGGLVAAVGGLVIGLPSLRLRGDYLAIATLGFGEIIRVILLNINAVGGARGLTGIPRYSNLFLVFGAAAVTIIALHNLLNSVHGRALLAIREDETAAEALGIDCAYYKTTAFVIGAFFAGVAGCLYAHYLQYIIPRGFNFMRSIELVLMVVLGGGNLLGTSIAAVFITLLPEGLRQVKDLLHLQTDPRMVIYAALLIAVMLFRRDAVFRGLSVRRKGGKRRGT